MSALSAIFVLKENGTQSHSAIFLNWGDHVNSFPDLAASPLPLMFTLYTGQLSVPTLDFLKVVRLVFWSGVVGPGTLARAPRSYDRATRSKARLVSKSMPTQKLFSIM